MSGERAYQRERLDDAASGVVGIRDGFTRAQTERCLPSVHRIVVLIYTAVLARSGMVTKLDGSG